MPETVAAGGRGARGGRLERKRALIAGGASGIGAATAERFREEGATVVVGDLNPGPDDLELDARSSASARAAVEAAVAQLGGLDILVCTVGRPVVASIGELEEADWEDALASNLSSVYHLARAAWLHLGSSRGCIVTTASVVGLTPVGVNQAAYAAAKAGVAMLTRSLAHEGGPSRIRVNCVCPGFTETPMMKAFMDQQPDPAAARAGALALHPLGRLGRPLDLANAFLYLASDEAEWVTGVVLPVDGGFLSGIA